MSVETISSASEVADARAIPVAEAFGSIVGVESIPYKIFEFGGREPGETAFVALASPDAIGVDPRIVNLGPPPAKEEFLRGVEKGRTGR